MPFTSGAAPLIGWSTVHAGIVAIAILGLGVPIALREGRHHAQPRLPALLLASLVLHLVGAVTQAEVVAHYYGNSADFQRYDGQGAALAIGIRHLHLATAGLTIPGTGTVSVVTGVVYAVTGVDQLGGFFVFTALSWVGLLCFYRAARLALPGVASKRYAVLLFLLPSLLYWPSQAGKEALMLLGLGIATYGAALLYVGRTVAGVLTAAPALIGAAYVRPHEVALIVAAFVVGAVARRPGARPRARTRWAVTAGLGVGALVLAAIVTAHFLGLDSVSSSALQNAIRSANGHTQRSGGGFGSSHGGWSSSPLAYPRDVVTVLLEPLPWRVSSLVQAIALVENLILITLVVRFRRSLLGSLRAAARGGMPLMLVVYCVLFVYVFAALGNIGLLERERTLLFPFLLMLLCAPPAESRRRARARAQRAEWDVPGVLVGVLRHAEG